MEPACVGRVKRQYRYHTIIKTPKTVTEQQAKLRAVVKKFGKVPRGYHVAIDVDAIGLF